MPSDRHYIGLLNVLFVTELSDLYSCVIAVHARHAVVSENQTISFFSLTQFFEFFNSLEPIHSEVYQLFYDFNWLFAAKSFHCSLEQNLNSI